MQNVSAIAITLNEGKYQLQPAESCDGVATFVMVDYFKHNPAIEIFSTVLRKL
jgi:hypothetical protein